MNLFIGYLIVINSLSFLLMWTDKRRARTHAWRISEKRLWIATIFGGAIGSWLGMRTFKHKTKHHTFKYGVPFFIALQAALYIFLALS